MAGLYWSGYFSGSLGCSKTNVVTYSGLTKIRTGGEPQTVHTLRQGGPTLYWFLLIHHITTLPLEISNLTAFQANILVYIPFTLAPPAGAGHFLSLLRQRKEAKKGDCGHRFGFAKLPSLRAAFRAGSQLAATPLRPCKPLFPEKPRSVRLRQQRMTAT